MHSTAEPMVPQALWEWLAMLHTVTAGASTSAETQARIGLVAPMLATRYPADVFNRASLEHVAAGCRFWPAYGEIVKRLDEWRLDLWRRASGADRTMLVPYDGPSGAPASRLPPDEAEKAAVRAMVGDLVAELRASAAAREGPPPPPLPDVTLKGEALARFRGARGSAGAAEPTAPATRATTPAWPRSRTSGKRWPRWRRPAACRAR